MFPRSRSVTVSLKAARRDIASLKEIALTSYVGSRRKGRHRKHRNDPCREPDGPARFLRFVRYARQNAKSFYAHQFELSFSVDYRLLSIRADGIEGFLG